MNFRPPDLRGLMRSEQEARERKMRDIEAYERVADLSEVELTEQCLRHGLAIEGPDMQERRQRLLAKLRQLGDGGRA